LTPRKFLPMLTIAVLLATMIAARAGTEIPTTLAQGTTVSISKVYDMKTNGTTFLVYINITNVQNLQIWLMNLSWDPAIIKITTGDAKGIKPTYPLFGTMKYDVYEGGFITNVYGNATIFRLEEVNNTEGWVRNLKCGLSGGSVSGSGALAIINFTLVGNGTTNINITGGSALWPGRSRLQDNALIEIGHDDVWGLVTDQPSPTPEIWAQLWFQVTMAVVVIVVLAAIYMFYRRRRPPKPVEAEKEEEEIEEED